MACNVLNERHHCKARRICRWVPLITGAVPSTGNTTTDCNDTLEVLYSHVKNLRTLVLLFGSVHATGLQATQTVA